jgi:hypothetical protein
MKKLLLFLVLLSNSSQIFTAGREDAELLMHFSSAGSFNGQALPAGGDEPYAKRQRTDDFLEQRAPEVVTYVGMPPIAMPVVSVAVSVPSRMHKFNRIPLHYTVIEEGPSKGKLKCNDCDSTFTSRATLRNHWKVKHNPEYVRLKCDGCDSTFTSKTTLRNHWEIKHNPEFVPLKCDRCDATFSKKCNLDRHKKCCKGQVESSIPAPAAAMSSVELAKSKTTKPFQYKIMHPDDEPAAEEISSGPSPVNVLSGELVEESDSDDEFDDDKFDDDEL